LFYSLTIRLEENGNQESWHRALDASQGLPPQDIQEHVRRHDQYKRYALLKHKLLSQEWTISTKGSRSSNSSELQPTQHTTVRIFMVVSASVFLLTPKLLSDLEYGEACTILTIMNGLWMDEPSEVSAADIKVKG
ncbi:hypothetical protein Tco_0825637, partial [Tanacetum coccineum]